jgi:uncharacterized integral membrane protein
MKAKVVILLIIVFLFTVFVSQNTTVITINAFLWTFQMSLIVIMSLTGLFGVLIGFIVASISQSSKRKKQKMKEEMRKEKEKKNQNLDGGKPEEGKTNL